MKPSNEFCVAFLKASGWLDNHDAEVRTSILDKFINKVKSVQFHTGRAWFDFDAGIAVCIDIAEKLKEDYT